MRGTLTLKRQDGEIVRMRVYNKISRYKEILSAWQHQYGKKFKELIVDDKRDDEPRKSKKERKNDVPMYGNIRTHHNKGLIRKK